MTKTSLNKRFAKAQEAQTRAKTIQTTSGHILAADALIRLFEGINMHNINNPSSPVYCIYAKSGFEMGLISDIGVPS